MGPRARSRTLAKPRRNYRRAGSSGVQSMSTAPRSLVLVVLNSRTVASRRAASFCRRGARLGCCVGFGAGRPACAGPRRRLPGQERERAFTTEVERSFIALGDIRARAQNRRQVWAHLPRHDLPPGGRRGTRTSGGHWNQVAATYVKFGDLSGANGYKLYSLLDGRSEEPEHDVSSLLVQVTR